MKQNFGQKLRNGMKKDCERIFRYIYRFDSKNNHQKMEVSINEQNPDFHD